MPVLLRRLCSQLILLTSLVCTTTAGGTDERLGKAFYPDIVHLIHKTLPQSCNESLDVTLMLDTSQSMDGTLKEAVLQAVSKIGRYYLHDGDKLQVVPFNKTLMESKAFPPSTFRNEAKFRKHLNDLFTTQDTVRSNEGKLFYTPQLQLMKSLKANRTDKSLPLGILITNVNSGTLEKGKLPKQDMQSKQAWEKEKWGVTLAEGAWNIAPKSNQKPLLLVATLFAPKDLANATRLKRLHRQLYNETGTTSTPFVPPAPSRKGLWVLVLLFVSAILWLGHALKERKSSIRLEIESLLPKSDYTCTRELNQIRLFSYAGVPPALHSEIEIIDEENSGTHTHVTKNDLFFDLPLASDLTPRQWLSLHYDSGWVASPTRNQGQWQLFESDIGQETIQSAPLSLPNETLTTLIADPRDNRRYILRLLPLDNPLPRVNRYKALFALFAFLAIIFSAAAFQEPTPEIPQSTTSHFEDLCHP